MYINPTSFVNISFSKMISTKKVNENLYSVEDLNKTFLQYRKDSEYVNATALCKLLRPKCGNLLGQWLRSKTAMGLIHDLGWYLSDAKDIRPYYIDGTINNNIFIHPSMVFSLVLFLDPKYNYPICKLMQQIMRNNAIDDEF